MNEAQLLLLEGYIKAERKFHAAARLARQNPAVRSYADGATAALKDALDAGAAAMTIIKDAWGLEPIRPGECDVDEDEKGSGK